MVALVTTLHDPNGLMVEATRRLYRRIAELYEAVVVVPTPSTSPHLLDALPGATVEPLAESNGSVGVGRRHALRLGLRCGARWFHYCDFDRLLHWIDRYPEELASLQTEIQGVDYLIIGRTERAFNTHPRVQRDTERITNHAFSLWFGRPVDVTAGSCGVSRETAALLLRKSVASSNATDTEWPALVALSGGKRIGYVQTEGLEFETADYFIEEIAVAGSLEAWLEERSRPLSAWVARVRLALESLEAALSVIESHDGRAPDVAR